MRHLKTVFLTTSLFVLIVLFQNCKLTAPMAFIGMGQASYSSSSSDAGGGTAGGNGSGYDGKPRIYHHLVDGFTCEGLDRPESILILRSNGQWLLIQNTLEKCEAINRAPVQGVVYDEPGKRATYEGKVYVPPLPYVVDATEDPNLDDIALDDGVCADLNQRCSLRAAVSQAAVASVTADVLVKISSGVYTLTQQLLMERPVGGQSVTLRGDDPATTILDGGGAVPHLHVFSATGALNSAVNVENLTFRNGYSTDVLMATLKFQARVTDRTSIFRVTNCQFSENRGVPAISANSGESIEVRRSRFFDNSEGVSAGHSARVLFEDSLVDRSGVGLSVYGVESFLIRRSSFVGNQLSGLSLGECRSNCRVENSTISENGGYGVSIGRRSEVDITFSNSTIYKNGLTARIRTNFYLNLSTEVPTRIAFNNSIVAQDDPANSNCYFDVSNSWAWDGPILATGSLVDDTSCRISSTGNFIGISPRLSPLADNGGLTPTLRPQSNSPVIEAGNNADCSTEDQRGAPRPVDVLGRGPRCDIGAVEEQYGTQ